MLHIYPQASWHEEAYVVGNIDGLVALRDAINRALGTGSPQAATEFPADGEGYRVLVLPVSEDGVRMLRLPYCEPKEEWPGKHPFEVMDNDIYKKLMRGG